MEETSDGLRRRGMASDNETIQLELVKAILEELPFGVLVTKNEKEIVLCNRVLSEAFAENQFDRQIHFILEKNLYA
jgi:c-di-AMP phosphodiesterase-like protein